ncbi:hypothetical protein PLESTF_001411000 [Pleodorina starrii]|nr:hypothetical protein PLESTF_001411000 [Pleodorina starrii]
MLTTPFTIGVFMVRDFEAAKLSGHEGEVDEQVVGRMTGLLAGIFSFSSFLTAYAWGCASNYIGRKPVVVIGNLVSFVSLLWFGLSGSYGTALAARAFGGFFNGILGAWKCMIGESTDVLLQGKFFGYISLAWGLGCIAGPALGGAFSRPCSRLPRLPLCGEGQLLAARPYFLACLVGSTTILAAFLLSVLLLEETLPQQLRERGLAAALDRRRRRRRRERRRLLRRQQSGEEPDEDSGSDSGSDWGAEVGKGGGGGGDGGSGTRRWRWRRRQQRGSEVEEADGGGGGVGCGEVAEAEGAAERTQLLYGSAARSDGPQAAEACLQPHPNPHPQRHRFRRFLLRRGDAGARAARPPSAAAARSPGLPPDLAAAPDAANCITVSDFSDGGCTDPWDGTDGEDCPGGAAAPARSPRARSSLARLQAVLRLSSRTYIGVNPFARSFSRRGSGSGSGESGSFRDASHPPAGTAVGGAAAAAAAASTASPVANGPRLDGCGHDRCRDCDREYVDEGREARGGSQKGERNGVHPGSSDTDKYRHMEKDSRGGSRPSVELLLPPLPPSPPCCSSGGGDGGGDSNRGGGVGGGGGRQSAAETAVAGLPGGYRDDGSRGAGGDEGRDEALIPRGDAPGNECTDAHHQQQQQQQQQAGPGAVAASELEQHQPRQRLRTQPAQEQGGQQGQGHQQGQTTQGQGGEPPHAHGSHAASGSCVEMAQVAGGGRCESGIVAETGGGRGSGGGRGEGWRTLSGDGSGSRGAAAGDGAQPQRHPSTSASSDNGSSADNDRDEEQRLAGSHGGGSGGGSWGRHGGSSGDGRRPALLEPVPEDSSVHGAGALGAGTGGGGGSGGGGDGGLGGREQPRPGGLSSSGSGSGSGLLEGCGTDEVGAASWRETGGGGPPQHRQAAGQSRQSRQQQEGEEATVVVVEVEGGAAAEERLLPWFRYPQIVLTILGYGAVALIFCAVDEVFPIFASAPLTSGGLGMREDQIAPPLMFFGAVLMPYSLYGYPPLQRVVGTLRLTRAGLAASVVTCLMIPAVADIRTASRVAAQVFLYGAMVVKAFAQSSAFTGSIIAVNAAPSPAQLGAVNGVGQTLAALVRGVGPALGGLLWAVSLGLHSAGQQFLTFGLIAAVAAVNYGLYGFVRLPNLR